MRRRLIASAGNGPDERRYRPAVSIVLPSFLLRLFDPAGAYFIKAERDFRRAEGASTNPAGPVHEQGAVYGPDLPDGGRPADAEERVWLADRHAEHLDRYRDTEEAVLQRWGPSLRDAVDDLLDKGSVTVQLGERTIEARVVRFWHGNSVLATKSQGPTGGGASVSRISRDPRQEPPGVLLDYLVRAATKG
jgi:hypothetical protein